MKIALITTLASLIENKRIKEEVLARGHEFSLINLRDFKFHIRNSKFVVDELENLNADVLIVRGVFNSIRSISEVMKDLRLRGIKIFDNNFLVHQYSINKVVDMVKLSLAGVKVPDTAHLRTFEEYSPAAEKIGYPLIVKSTRMGKGVGVYKINDSKKLASFIDEVAEDGKSAKNYLLQQFIPYVHDLRVLVVGENIFTMKRIPAEGEFRANFSLGGSVEPFSLDKNGEMMAKQAMKVVEMSIGGVDILITEKDERYVLEVNHTAGFVGMEKATGKNIGKLWVEYAIENAR